MKNYITACLLLLSTILHAQMDWGVGEYALYSTSKSGMHQLTGSELMAKGILNAGDSLSRLVLWNQTDGALSSTNSMSASTVSLVSLKIIDADGLLDVDSKVLFYVNTPFEIELLDSTYSYQAHPYSEREYFIVSATLSHLYDNTMSSFLHQGMSATREINESAQIWVYDTAVVNLVSTGRRWFGDLYDFTTLRTYTLPFVPKTGVSLEIEVSAVARASTSNTSLSIVGAGSVVFPAVGTSSVSHYVTEKTLKSSLFQTSASAQVSLSFDKAGNAGAAMWLDKLIVNYRTSNQYQYNDQAQKRFQNFSRGAGNVSLIKVPYTDSQPLVFEVTNKEGITEISSVNTAGVVSWESSEDLQREYVLCAIGDAYLPKFERTSELNQMPYYNGIANLIIAPDSLMFQANRLASIHENSGLQTKAISLENIYAIINCGTPDIAAIRRFLFDLKTMYAPDLRYLTLFGDASFDYKDKLPNRSNLVPTFESYGSFSLYSSYITDDYFGYLDEGEGVNWFAEDLDLGIGRIPVKTILESTEMVDKIDRYLFAQNRLGPWRSKAILVADDADHAWEKEFAVVQDALAKRLDTTRPELSLIKIYADAYQQEAKPGSQRYPTAREKLFREVDDGALLVSYIGHGGEVGWATERILQLEDIQNWTNSINMPVFTTITCEFTRFDDPNRVSAGEQLLLNPIGGAIALFSTTRSVFATNSTYDINRLLNQQMMSLESPRLGDVIRTTKNNNISGDKIKFSLIGDPALPLARPELAVVMDSINGQLWTEFNDTLNALSWVRVQGHISETVNPGLINNFNGNVWLNFYDKSQPQSTQVNDGSGTSFNFTTQTNAIFRGIASVKNGSFELTFRVPLDINLSVGSPKVSSYASDASRDAWGGDASLLIGGIYDGIVTDNEGPEVRLFINDTLFKSGSISGPNPIAIGKLSDESGINAVGLGIGHNINLTLDGESISANDFYLSDLDDFTSGTLAYPFYDVAVGKHLLELRAWDVLNQWGYDSLSFIVLDHNEPILNHLFAYPNPFTTEVRFNLNHNQQSETGILSLDIVNNQGQTIWSWSEQLTLQASETSLPVFKISDIPSGKLTTGFYYARATWKRNEDGKSTSIQEKLIFIR